MKVKFSTLQFPSLCLRCFKRPRRRLQVVGAARINFSVCWTHHREYIWLTSFVAGRCVICIHDDRMTGFTAVQRKAEWENTVVFGHQQKKGNLKCRRTNGQVDWWSAQVSCCCYLFRIGGNSILLLQTNTMEEEEEEAMVADRGSVEENYYNRVDYTRDEFVIVYTKSGNLYSNSYILAQEGGGQRGAK